MSLQVGSSNEADKSAGTPIRSLTHSVLREEISTISPLMLLDEQRMKCALGSLYKQVMLERGMRDDFCGIGHSKGNEDADEDTPVVSVVEEEDEAVTPSSSKVRKGVSFHEDTKAGRASAPTIETSKETKKNVLPMRMYRPPSKHIRCSLGW